jgi:glycosyltransferase involved in cell wall biosynthesis
VLVGMPFAEPHGGSERLLLALLGHARDHGLDLHVAFLADGGMIEQAQARGVETSLVPVRRPNHPGDAVRAVGRFRRLLAAERPDVVLSWHSRAHMYLGPAARLLRRRPPVGWWQHHLAGRERLERAATLIPADLVVATSQAAAGAQLRLWPRRRCVVVNPGIEPPPRTTEEALGELRGRLDLPSGAPVVGIVGRLVEWKGQHRFLDALALLRDEGHEVVGLVVGGTTHGLEPEYAGKLRRLAADRRLEDRVRFTGQVEDPLPYVQLMDVLVNASDPEPFGMTLLEAMALEVPVVAVAAGGPLEIAADGASAVLVPDGSPQALAEGIARLLTDPDARRALAAAARERYERRFTADRFAGETAEVLRTLAGRRSRTAR